MDVLSNKTAIITGGGSGVGKAIALALAAQKVNICLVGRRLNLLEVVADEARRFGARGTCFSADLASEIELRDVIGKLTADAGAVDILVHSAAIVERAGVDSAPPESLDRHYQVNVRAPYVLTRALLPMLRSRKGDVVFINSSLGIAAKPLFVSYGSTKHALKGMADSLREEVNADGVRVLSVYLGRTAGDMQAKLHAEEGKPYLLELLLQPEDIASVVLGALQLPRTAEVTDIHIRPAIKS
jgi:NAD(P)-dependent dehydrogenase (short-subunit alcohol dehydrogenase family)